jgi:hypothetical protein
MSRLQNPLRCSMVVVVGGVSLFLLLKLMGYGLDVVTGRNRIEERQRQLLYHTDHPALLAACRQLLKQNKQDKDYFYKVDGKIPKEYSDLPMVLRHLNPMSVNVLKDQAQVHIELGGGFFHHGFIAQAEGAEEEHTSTPEEGYRKLLPGLWYYAEDNRIPNEK